MLQTTGGTIYTGVLVEKTESAVVLKNAQAKEIHVPAEEIEQLAPQAKSLMPDLSCRAHGEASGRLARVFKLAEMSANLSRRRD